MSQHRAVPEETPADPDLVYGWLRKVLHTPEDAEALTLEVFRRLRLGGPRWLATKPVDVQQRFRVAQVVLERRGVLPARGGGSSTAARRDDV